MPENKNNSIADGVDNFTDKIVSSIETSNVFENIIKIAKVIGLAGVGIGGFVLGQKLEDSQNLSEMVEKVKGFFGKGGLGDPSTQAKAQEPIKIPDKAEIESVKPKGDETAKSDTRKAKAEKSSINTKIALDNATKMNKLTERSKEIMSNYGLKSITSRTESVGTANIDKNFGKTDNEIATSASVSTPNAITIQDIAATINTDHIETLLAANNDLLATISQQVGLIHSNQVTEMVNKKSKAQLLEILSRKDDNTAKILEEQNAKVESYTETLMKSKLEAENKSNKNLASLSDDNKVGFKSKVLNFPWGKTLKTVSGLAMPFLLKQAYDILTAGSAKEQQSSKEKAELSDDITNDIKNGSDYYLNGKKIELGEDEAINVGYKSDAELDDQWFSVTRGKKEREALKNRIDNGTANLWDNINYYGNRALDFLTFGVSAAGTAIGDAAAYDKIEGPNGTSYGEKVKIPKDWIKTAKGTYLHPNDTTTLGVVEQLDDGRFVIVNKSLSKEFFINGKETGRCYNNDNGLFYDIDHNKRIVADQSKLSKGGFIRLDAFNSEGRAIYARYDETKGYELAGGGWGPPDKYMSNVKKYMADGKGGVTELTMEGPDDKKRNTSVSTRSNTRGSGKSISISNNSNFIGFNSVHGYADALDDSGIFVETSSTSGASIPEGTMSPVSDLPTPEDMDETSRQQAIAAANEMMRLKDSLVYSQAQRNPEKGSSDCSSTVQYVLKKTTGIDPGYNTVSQITNESGTWVDRSSIKYDGTGDGKVPDESKLAPGDIIFVRPSPKRQDLSRPYRVGHAEMYVGNGMLMGQTGEAPGHKGPVLHKLDTPWIVRGYIGAKRFIKNKDYSSIPLSVMNPKILNDEKAEIGAKNRAKLEEAKIRTPDGFVSNLKTGGVLSQITGVKHQPNGYVPTTLPNGTPTSIAINEANKDTGKQGDVMVNNGGNDQRITVDNSQSTVVNNNFGDYRSLADPNLLI